MSKLLSHTSVFRVRYADTDRMGIVYNGNYFSFFETGRTELMRNFGLPYTQVEENGFYLPLTAAHINYKNAAYYDQVLEINTKLQFENTIQFKFDYKIEYEGKEIANGYTKHVFVKKESMKPVRPPKFFIDIINGLENV